MFWTKCNYSTYTVAHRQLDTKVSTEPSFAENFQFREVPWNFPITIGKRIYLRDGILIFCLEIPQNTKSFIVLFCFKYCHMLFLEMPNLQDKIILKGEHFKEKARDLVENRIRTEIKTLRILGHLKEIRMPSRDKILLRMLFGHFKIIYEVQSEYDGTSTTVCGLLRCHHILVRL